MATLDEQVQQATAAFRAGRKEEARTILMQVIEQDERHEKAWLVLSAVVGTLEEQQICLENVLAVSPDNEQARRGLEVLNQKLAARKSDAPSPPAQDPGRSAGTSAPIGAEFASVSGDSLLDASPPDAPVSGQSADESFDDWLTATTESASSDRLDLPATSVDWGRPDGPTAYGSGRRIDEPTPEEYDSWMASLNLGEDSAIASPIGEGPFSTEDAGSFGDTSFMIADEAEEASPAEEPAADQDTFAAFGAFDLPDADDDEPFDAEAVGGASSAFGSPFSSFGEPGTDEVDAPFDEVNEDRGFDEVGWLENRLNNSTSPPPSPVFKMEPDFEMSGPAFGLPETPAFTAPAAPSSAHAAYYRQIPAEIEAETGSESLQGWLLLAGVVVMAVLNLLSFGYLITSL
jgi:hypothetical protein